LLLLLHKITTKPAKFGGHRTVVELLAGCEVRNQQDPYLSS